jgi:flagellar motor switch/type III secretory pathway protein FliN
MSTAQPIAGQVPGKTTGQATGQISGQITGQKSGSASLPVATATGSNPALVPAPSQPEEDEESELRAPVTRLPVELDVMIPVREFRVRDLLALEPGRLIESQWANGEDLPLNSGDVLLAWSEFEVVDTQLAVRVTRLA